MILNKIIASTKIRVAKAKENLSPSGLLKALDKAELKAPNFKNGLVSIDDVSIIAEIKKASPSKGLIRGDFDHMKIAEEYDKCNIQAMSVLTEPEYFKGNIEFVKDIKSKFSIPVLRKDFTVDEYQIYEAKVIGASAVLLICALLDTETIRKRIEICDSLGLSALVEAHTEEEVKSALDAGARIIGVNNRNLKDFTVDLTTCTRLRKLVPKEILFVGESGIKTAEDVQELREAGVNGLLIGETLMRNADKKKALEELNGDKL